MANRSRFGLAYAVQSGYGTAATSGFKFLPVTTWDPGVSANRVADNTADGSRLGKVGRSGTLPVAPKLTCNHRDAVYDDLLANLFQNAWATDVLTQGSTQTWMTLQDTQPDAGSGAYIHYRDSIVNSLELLMQPNGYVQDTWSFLGTQVTVDGTPVSSPTAAGTNPPFATWEGALTYGGSAFSVTSLKITFNNNLEGRYAIGSRNIDRIVENLDQVTGEMTCAYLGPARLNDMLNDTTNALVVTLTYGTTGQVFTFPAVHTTGWQAQLSTDPERLQTLNFEAEAVSGTKCSITRDNT